MAVWPLATFSTDSNSLVWISGTALMTPALLSDGLGSLTKPVMREMVGRTLSETISSSLICGVTFMTKPIGTEMAVVVNVVTEVVWFAVVSALTSK